MAWLDDTEPFELKPHITRKRIMRGLTPERRKWKDASKLRKQVRLYLLFSMGGVDWFGIDSNGIPYWLDENGKRVHRVAGWNRNFIDGKAPHSNGKSLEETTGHVAKSSRRYMRLVASWWSQVDINNALHEV